MNWNNETKPIWYNSCLKLSQCWEVWPFSKYCYCMPWILAITESLWWKNSRLPTAVNLRLPHWKCHWPSHTFASCSPRSAKFMHFEPRQRICIQRPVDGLHLAPVDDHDLGSGHVDKIAMIVVMFRGGITLLSCWQNCYDHGYVSGGITVDSFWKPILKQLSSNNPPNWSLEPLPQDWHILMIIIYA